jgi:hypothetical protein
VQQQHCRQSTCYPPASNRQGPTTATTTYGWHGFIQTAPPPPPPPPCTCSSSGMPQQQHGSVCRSTCCDGMTAMLSPC